MRLKTASVLDQDWLWRFSLFEASSYLSKALVVDLQEFQFPGGINSTSEARLAYAKVPEARMSQIVDTSLVSKGPVPLEKRPPAGVSSEQCDLEAQARSATSHSQWTTAENTSTSFTAIPMNALPSRRPWEDAGYPKLCEFIASADNVLVLRRFNKLHARALLQLQDEIAEQEERINQQDDETRAEVDPKKRHLDTMRADPHDERQRTLKELRGQLTEYGVYLAPRDHCL